MCSNICYEVINCFFFIWVNSHSSSWDDSESSYIIIAFPICSRNIYQHLPEQNHLDFVGKYTSTMEHIWVCSLLEYPYRFKWLQLWKVPWRIFSCVSRHWLGTCMIDKHPACFTIKKIWKSDIIPICSMYVIFTYICPKNHPNVGKSYMEHMGYLVSTNKNPWDLIDFIIRFPRSQAFFREIKPNFLPYLPTFPSQQKPHTRWYPPSHKLVYNPINYRYIYQKSKREIGVLGTNWTHSQTLGAPSFSHPWIHRARLLFSMVGEMVAVALMILVVTNLDTKARRATTSSHQRPLNAIDSMMVNGYGENDFLKKIGRT